MKDIMAIIRINKMNQTKKALEESGITSMTATGRVLGLMPHPERHFLFEQHPFWTRLSKKSEFGDGAKIFENGVNYVKENLLR